MLSPAPDEKFTIVVSGAELNVIRLALGRMVEPEPVKKPTVRRGAEAPVYATGDARLDEFMRKHHRRGWKPPTVPRGIGKPPTLPKGSPIGKMVALGELGECQIVSQTARANYYGATNGKGWVGWVRVDPRDGDVSVVASV